jgi:DNA invertase Pin-like site-specific DNA recombinase
MALRVIGYVRVSTEDQADSGAGLEAQRAHIREAATQRGWDLVAIREDTSSGKSLNARRGLEAALHDVEAGGASVLVVSKVDRLSRSVVDFASLVERSRRRGWALVALDVGIDMTQPQGQMVANIMASFAEFERRIIGVRTKEALAIKRQQGVRLGRPPKLSDATLRRIGRHRSRGGTLAAIAARLNRDGVPTAHGGRRWHVSAVQSALRRGARAVHRPSKRKERA